MITVSLILALLSSVQSQNPTTVKHVTGSLDENGVCHCAINLPDSTFPADRLEYLEIYNRNLSISVEQQVTKIHSYELLVTMCMEKLKNLTAWVEKVEKGELSYTELDFELLKLEITEMEALIVQLKDSLNGTNAIVETLYAEIHNISTLVHQMESYDKNNVLAIRRDIVILQKRLEECRKQVNSSHPPPHPPPVKYGSCEHGEIVNISKPFVVQLNYLGSSYLRGGFGKDSVMGGGKGSYFVAPLQTSDSRLMNVFRTYATYNDVTIYKMLGEKVLSKYNPSSGRNDDYTNCGQGSGATLYNDFLYYNCYNSRNLCKLNVDTNAVTRLTLTDAAYNNRFSYAQSTFQDIDTASDEDGLWVIYSTEQDFGNFVISKLNDTSFTVEQTWRTSQYKPAATNAFMACGVLYATRALNTQTEEIYYMYDTKTGKESYLSIPYDKMKETVHSLSYNPNEHKLYMYNDGFLATYDITFQLVESEKSRV
uniref:Olfactomedin-like domain-containing protein n=1 Tax=Leptobrachium leishanense TaxID=445787 RepID=A0A8C5WH73_9ANUR